MARSKQNKSKKTCTSDEITLGGRTTNRHPSKISPDDKELVKILASNIDSLVLTFDILWEGKYFFSVLSEAKGIAQSNKKPFPVPFLIGEGFDEYYFDIKEYGSKGYEWILINKEYSFTVGSWSKPKAMPSVIVTIRSETLWRKGPYRAVQFIINFLQKLGGKIIKSRVSRVDLCVDTLFPSKLWLTDILSFAVTRAATDSTFEALSQSFRSHKNISTINIGSGIIKARLYDKLLEIKQKSNKTWFYDVWNLKEVPENSKIIRVEFQLRREALKELGINSIDDLFRLIHNAWSYCTKKWLKFQSNPGKQSHQREILSWWKTIQNGFCSIPAGTSLIRGKAANADKNRLSQQILGLMSSFAAIELETGDSIDPKHINILSAFEAFQNHLNKNNLNNIEFPERVQSKKAKFQRLDEKYLQCFDRRKEFGLLPNSFS